MLVYSIQELNKTNNKSIYCDRIILFSLPNSNIAVAIKDNHIIVRQRRKYESFYRGNLSNEELVILDVEKSLIELWTKYYKYQLLNNVKAQQIIKNDTNKVLVLKKSKMNLRKDITLYR